MKYIPLSGNFLVFLNNWLHYFFIHTLFILFFLRVSGSSPSNTAVLMVYNVTYGPFWIALWLLLLYYVISAAALRGREPGTGRNVTITSHQQSTRFTRRPDLDLGQSTNTPLLCSSLFVSLKQSGQLTPKMSDTHHHILSFSSDLQWPLWHTLSCWTTCNHLVAAKQSCSLDIIGVCGCGGWGGSEGGEGGGGRRGGVGAGGVTEKSYGVWRQIRQADSEFAPLLLTSSCSVASVTPKGHEGSHWRNLELGLKN